MDTTIPEEMREILPAQAERIFEKAFDQAWKKYDSPKKRKTKATREEIAYKYAWTAVKEAGFKKDKKTGKWIKQYM